jgi:hypothetical protein
MADTPTIAKYLKDHFCHLRPLAEEIAKTQKDDADKFLHMLPVSNLRHHHPELQEARRCGGARFHSRVPDKKRDEENHHGQLVLSLAVRARDNL